LNVRLFLEVCSNDWIVSVCLAIFCFNSGITCFTFWSFVTVSDLTYYKFSSYL
jgi:hypothetical protein